MDKSEQLLAVQFIDVASEQLEFDEPEPLGAVQLQPCGTVMAILPDYRPLVSLKPRTVNLRRLTRFLELASATATACGGAADGKDSKREEQQQTPAWKFEQRVRGVVAIRKLDKDPLVSWRKALADDFVDRLGRIGRGLSLSLSLSLSLILCMHRTCVAGELGFPGLVDSETDEEQVTRYSSDTCDQVALPWDSFGSCHLADFADAAALEKMIAQHRRAAVVLRVRSPTTQRPFLLARLLSVGYKRSVDPYPQLHKHGAVESSSFASSSSSSLSTSPRDAVSERKRS